MKNLDLNVWVGNLLGICTGALNRNIKMKKLFSVYAFILSVIIFSTFVACDNNEFTSSDEKQRPEELFVQNEYNLDLKNFALSVSKAMNESKDFRKLIKKEALAKFDGDYDILLRNIVDQPVKVDNSIQLRSSNGENATVKDLLESCYDSGNSSEVNLRSSTSMISELQQKYPGLQIAIPVNAENWEEEGEIPPVTFIPEEYEEYVTEYVAAYNSDGSVIKLDAIEPPKYPILVIGMNERMNAFEPTVCPSAPYNLTAVQTQSGIQLSWQHSQGREKADFPLGYKIYRKSPQNSNFILLTTNSGISNTVYWDQSVEVGMPYSYYVIAYNALGSSPQSNVISVTAPARPSSLISFSADVLTPSSVELRWGTDPSQYIESVQLFRDTQFGANGYSLYQTFGSNDYDFFDHDIVPGNTIRYKLQITTPTGVSNPKYDIVKIPYRNPSQPSPIRIKHINCCKNCEGWLYGKPDLQIIILGVDQDRKTVEVGSLYIDMDEFNQDFDRFVLDWQPDSWYQMYTFQVIEEDSGRDDNITVTANVNYKKEVSDGITLDTQAGVSATFKRQNHVDIGAAYLNYFDPINKALHFEKTKYWCDITFGQ
jgi:hypothetical protein